MQNNHRISRHLSDIIIKPHLSIRHLKARNVSDNYTVFKTIGKGAQSTVRLAVHKTTGKHVALKMVSKISSHYKFAKMEAALLTIVGKHPNISSLVETFFTNNHFVMVFEFMKTDLFSFLEHNQTFHDQTVKYVVKQILQGLLHCHLHGVAHRDIKPENILVDSTTIQDATCKICDFGLATKIERVTTTVCGSDAYMAPEIFQKNRNYDASKTDVWSAGVVLYNLLTGFAPWEHAVRTDRVYDRFCRTRKDFWDWTAKHSPGVVTEEFIDIFDGMCNPDPTLRWNASQALESRFLN